MHQQVHSTSSLSLGWMQGLRYVFDIGAYGRMYGCTTDTGIQNELQICVFYFFALQRTCRCRTLIFYLIYVPYVPYVGGVQWNLSIYMNKGHLSNEDTVCSPNHIELCSNLPLN